jgi:hypothetical protein
MVHQRSPSCRLGVRGTRSGGPASRRLASNRGLVGYYAIPAMRDGGKDKAQLVLANLSANASSNAQSLWREGPKPRISDPRNALHCSSISTATPSPVCLLPRLRKMPLPSKGGGAARWPRPSGEPMPCLQVGLDRARMHCGGWLCDRADCR